MASTAQPMSDVDDPRVSPSNTTDDGAAAAGSNDDDAAALDANEQLILEEYKIWKKHTPFLYDLVVTHSLEWPSLTVQWMPDREVPEGKDYCIQRLLLGTHTSGEEPAAANAAASSSQSSSSSVTPQNYLLLAEVRLPLGAQPARASKSTVDLTSTAATSIDDAPEEEGAYGSHNGKLEVNQYIPHQGEIHRARYAPHNPNLIATKSPAKEVFIFDKTRHASKPAAGIGQHVTAKPDLVLSGHTAEGYGLNWNPHATSPGLLLSGSSDSLICLWDVENGSREAKKAAGGNLANIGQVAPMRIFRGHTELVEDIAWSHFVPTLFASCGDDGKLLLWDTRSNDSDKASTVISSGRSTQKKGNGHHTDNINSVSFNYLSANLLVSGASDKIVNLWDLRRLHQPIHSLVGHTGEIFNVAFAPFSSDIVASSGADRRTNLWDLSRVGEQVNSSAEYTEEDAEDGPPELLFLHAGHTDKIADMCWNANQDEEWMIASVDDANVVQLWQISETIYSDDSEGTQQQQQQAGNGLLTASGHQVEEIE